VETQTLDEVDKSLEQAALAAQAQMAQMAQATVPVPVAVASNVTKAPNWEGHHGKLMQNRILTSLQKFMKDMKDIIILNGIRSERVTTNLR
jgi:hypothetical protein